MVVTVKLATSMDKETKKRAATAVKVIGVDVEQEEHIGMLDKLPEVGDVEVVELKLIALIMEPMECKVQ
jgi:hypothetical protein